jgi:hypothetical protein
VDDGKGGVATETVEVVIALQDTPPVLRPIPDITVGEGERIELPVSATDREGDLLTVRVSGWMANETYVTTYSDAGSHQVTVRVSDGAHTVADDVLVTVRDVNRPPTFRSRA